ncbi:MAG TPA: hypothetical protein VGJ97_07165 [Anaerolineaceae bacterium]|jgi:hypothetical protein
MNATNPTYLLTVQGLLGPKTLQEARAVHNSAAGAPANVAAARSLSDLSHMVYTPMDPAFAAEGQFLFLDLWSKLDGLNTFFSNPQVQEAGGHIFRQRDPVIWEPADGFISYHFPAPFGKNERYVAMVRGMVRSRPEAQAIHNELVGTMINQVRMAGDISHDAYFRVSGPGEPQSLEFCAIDVWMDAAGMGATYQNPDFLRGFQRLFSAPPAASIWMHPEGEWSEW